MAEGTAEGRAEGKPERADAARNRRAILRATESLLTRYRPGEISMEQVATAAGVGKGTVFHRFGSRTGLMVALMKERALALGEAVASGPPPLGPGAAARDRLFAFLDAVVDVVGNNKGLLAALGQTLTATRKETDDHSVYRSWHDHITALIREQRPDLDSPVLAHILLAALHNDAVIRLLEQGEGVRLAAALHTIAAGILDSPVEPGRPAR